MDASGGSGSNSHVWPIVDDNGAVDMNGMMDNIEERIVNLEMVFAYFKNKKMLEIQENKPKKDDNGAVDMNGMMDNIEERIVNLEMVFAYLKNKKMLEIQENKPKKDGTTSKDVAEFEVASKSTSFTSNPKKVTTHKVVTQKVQTKAFPVKNPVPIKNCILGLAAAYTWACTGNKTFGTRKQKDAIVAG
nr:hypothetical protein [Tanacetum cinerariifolium]